MFDSLFFRQLKATIQRNVLIKKRAKYYVFLEIFMPLYFIAILAIIKQSIPSSIIDAVNASQPVGNLSDPRISPPTEIAVVSNNTNTIKFLETMEMIGSKHKWHLHFTLFYNTELMVAAYRRNTSVFSSGIIFADNPLVNSSYTLYFPKENIPSLTTKFGNPRDCHGNVLASDCAANEYFAYGYLQLQALIETAFLQTLTNSKSDIPTMSLALMPKPRAVVNVDYMRSFLPVYTVIAFSPFLTYVVILIVREKENKIHIALKVMGLKDSVYWLSWFIVYGSFVLVLATIISILFNVTEILTLANVFLIFCSLLLYGLSIVTMAFMVTPFFNKAKVAGALCSLISTVFSCFYYLAVYVTDINPAVFWVMSLISPTALALGLDTAIKNEVLGVGLSFDNIWDGPFPFGATLIMLTLDVVLYALLAYYFDSVIPSEYGRKCRPWFLFLPSFWCPQKGPLSNFADLNTTNNRDSAVALVPSEDIEPVPSEFFRNKAIRVVNLTKTFKQRKKDDVIAVNGIDLDIYKGEITALLGHNGAGKTTLINMLLGIMPQDSGNISIFGLDVANYDDLTQIRRMTGICPQHDILFENLTPVEHLSFYAKIKGVADSEVDTQVRNIIQDVDLKEKANAHAVTLSGGQKRKLSLGISLIGDPQILVLDEPTSGVDPYSRHHLWSLLQNHKKDKVILLTTHFMDEADILADRKAILTKGRIRCVGSSLFLKNRFGMGYNLIIVVGDHFNEETITDFVHKHIPEAKKLQMHGQELVYLLPLKDVAHFPGLLSALDNVIQNEKESELDILSYGISMTSLEEVFLKLGEEDGEKLLDAEESVVTQIIKTRSPARGSMGDVKVENAANSESLIEHSDDQMRKFDEQSDIKCEKSELQAFKAILYIRFLNDLRLPKNVFSVIVFPIAMLCLSLYLFSRQEQPNQKDSLSIQSSFYQDDQHNPPLLYHIASPKSDVTACFSFLGEIKKLGVNIEDFSQPIEQLLNYNRSSVYYLGLNHYDIKTQQLNTDAVYNDTAVHSLMVLMNIINNARLNVKNSTFGEFIKLIIKTLPTVGQIAGINGFALSSTVIIGLIFTSTPVTLVIDVIEDKEENIRHLLRANGMSFLVYWSSYFLCHFVLMVISIIAMVIVMEIFQVNFGSSSSAVGCLIFIYLLYIPQAMTFLYVVSFIFKKHEYAQSVLQFVPLIVGFVPYIVVFIVDSLNPMNNTGTILHTTFCFLFPMYPPFATFYYINKVTNLHETLGFEAQYFNKEINIMIGAMIINIIIYCTLLRILDIRSMNGSVKSWILCNKLKSPDFQSNPNIVEDEDDDVSAEREKVENLGSDRKEMALVIHSLNKEFKKNSKSNCFSRCKKKTGSVEDEKSHPKIAVKNLSLAVSPGEVFGLLGPNGAGKTTTLKMVVTDEKPSLGKIYVSGHDVSMESREVYQSMSYCPQFDALWKNITVIEHMQCYSALRGIPHSLIPDVADFYIKGLNIEEHKKKRGNKLSGGTRRKLSFAISMMGDSRVVLMDEPSTGMDPISKRFFWNMVLSSFSGRNRAAFLTTHSMEEADALCTRVGIMVKGVLKCLGATQHLKNKYGCGYLLEMKLSPDRSFEACLEELGILFQQIFESHELKEKFGNSAKFTIPKNGVKSIALVFETLESAKETLGIIEYSFSQSTLEQVFIEFAKQQVEEEQ